MPVPPSIRLTRAAFEVIRQTSSPIQTLSFPAVVDFFLHNWAAVSILESSYQTDVCESADTLAEERVGLCDRPYRSISLRWNALDQDEATRLLMLMLRLGTARYTIPLYPDQSIVTAASSGTTINCDTTNRRFFRGGKILICEADQTGNCVNAQYGVIQYVSDTTLTLTSGLTGSYPAGVSIVFPLLDTEITLSASMKELTDSACDFSMTVEEVNGFSALPPTFTGDIVPNATVYQGYPVFDFETNWINDVEIAFNRAGQKYGRGRGQIVALRGSRPQFEFSFDLLFGDRADTFEFLNFFDSRRGRLRPFWLASPNALWGAPVAVTTGYVDVTAHGNLADLEAFVFAVAVVLEDGTVYVSNISSVTDNSGVNGTWRLNLSDAIPSVTLALVKRVTSAHLVRFSKDAIQENWQTDSVCQIKVGMTEILNEKEVDISGVDPA